MECWHKSSCLFTCSNNYQNITPLSNHGDINGYVKYIYIKHHYKIQDVIDYAKNLIYRGLYFSKAFDPLEWDLMFFALQKFGFKNQCEDGYKLT